MPTADAGYMVRLEPTPAGQTGGIAMRKLLGAGLVVAMSWGLVAPAGAVTASARLHKKLLSVSQLPAGWLHEGASSLEIFGCPASAFPSGSTAFATVSFNYKAAKAFPLLTEGLGTFASSSSAFAAMAGGLGGCATVSGTAHGSTFTGTIAKSSFGSYGNQSAGFTGKILLGGTTLALAVVIVRKGDELMVLEEGNTNSVSASGFRAFASAAAGKL